MPARGPPCPAPHTFAPLWRGSLASLALRWCIACEALIRCCSAAAAAAAVTLLRRCSRTALALALPFAMTLRPARPRRGTDAALAMPPRYSERSSNAALPLLSGFALALAYGEPMSEPSMSYEGRSRSSDGDTLGDPPGDPPGVPQKVSRVSPGVPRGGPRRVPRRKPTRVPSGGTPRIRPEYPVRHRGVFN